MKSRVCWLALAIFLLAVCLSEAATIKVQPEESIQAAINKAGPGDLIQVQGGVHRESLNITKQITLEGKGMPLIDSGAGGNAMTLRADGIVVSGFDVRTTRRAGIFVASDNNIIKYNNISCCTDGLRLEGAKNCQIASNWVSNNTNGITLISAGYNVITNNYIKDNSLGESHDCGIFLAESCHNLISNNNLSQNGDCSISLRSSSNNTIEGNNISKNDWYGISLEESSNNNLVLANFASDNGHGGICLDKSRGNSIRDNIAKENGRGIYLSFDSNDNTVEGNSLSLNEKGIHLAYHSSNNVITDNTALKNTYGIYIAFSSGWNRIFDNRLIDNNYNAYDLGLKNNWDNGSVGNYYSDLGSVVYIPGGSGVDRHPRSIDIQEPTTPGLSSGSLVMDKLSIDDPAKNDLDF